MQVVLDQWKDMITDALTKAGLLSSKFSGKFTITVADGGIRFVEISQTVK